MNGFLIRIGKNWAPSTHYISGYGNCHRQLQIFTFVVCRKHPIKRELLWNNKFTEKRDVEDDKLARPPIILKAYKNEEKIRTLVRTDNHLRIRINSEELHVNKGSVRQASAKNLNIKCVRKGSQKYLGEKLSVRRQIPTLKHAPYSSHQIFLMRRLSLPKILFTQRNTFSFSADIQMNMAVTYSTPSKLLQVMARGLKGS